MVLPRALRIGWRIYWADWKDLVLAIMAPLLLKPLTCRADEAIKSDAEARIGSKLYSEMPLLARPALEILCVPMFGCLVRSSPRACTLFAWQPYKGAAFTRFRLHVLTSQV